MSIDDWDAKKFTKEYEREFLNAQKRTGRKIGKKVVKEAKRALGRVSAKRKKLIKYKVRRNGTLVHIDSGYNARAREYGLTINSAPGSWLRIDLDPADRGKKGDFVAPVNGKMFLFENNGEDDRPIAVLKKRVVYRKTAVEKRLSKITEEHFKEYLKTLDEEIRNG